MSNQNFGNLRCRPGDSVFSRARRRGRHGAMPARYLIGIDLGTTNTAVAYVDTAAADPRVRVFDVPQLVAPGEVGPRRQLPSFVYLPGEHDLSPAETALPWRPVGAGSRDVVGELARGQGARNPA